MSEGRPEATARRSPRSSLRALLIVPILLLLGAAAGLVWLHMSGRLAPLMAATPHLEMPLAERPVPAPDAAADAAPEATLAAPEPETAEAPAAAPPADDTGGVGGEKAPAEKTTPGEPASDEAAPAAETAASAQRTTPATPEAGAATGPETGEPPFADAPPPQAPPAPLLEPGTPPSGTAPAETERTVSGSAAPKNTAPESTEPARTAAEGTTAAGAAAEGAANATPESAEPENTGPDNAEAGKGGLDATQLAAAAIAAGIPTWQRLARPFPTDETRPRIAVVVAGLGLSDAATTAAIQQLPAEITLSFSPYSNRIEEWVAMARAAGHEVLIDLPMEPTSFPRDDPGPRALLTSLGPDANAERLAWTLNRAEGFVGVATYMGSRFTTSKADMKPVVEALGERGLLLVDSRAAADSVAAEVAAAANVAHAINDRFIDNEASRVAIDGRLQQVERIARTNGVAVAMGYAYPVTIERLGQWARELPGEGLVLAPISAVTNRQAVR